MDDAIVMLENIVRHMEHGEGVMEAAINGFRGDRLHDSFDDAFAGRRVSPGAVHGRGAGPAAARVCGDDHVRHPGVGLCFADADADALQPLPATAPRTRNTGVLYNFFESMQVGLERGYDRCLQVVLRHQARHDACFRLFLLVGTYYLAVIIPKGFLPSEDIDQINGTTEAIEGISFDSMVQHQKQVAEIVVTGSGRSVLDVRCRHRRPHHESGELEHSAEATRRARSRWTR